jgi:hypothetical protein
MQTREQAAQTLSVSIRTLDRYIKTNKLKYKIINRSVFISPEELKKFAKQFKIQKTQNSTPKTKSAKIKIPKSAIKKITEPEAIKPKIKNSNSMEQKIFRELYQTTMTELKAKQEKLEAASFRVGQLETQLKNSVPLLELKQRETELENTNKDLKRRVKSMRTNFWIAMIAALFLAIIFGILGTIQENFKF